MRKVVIFVEGQGELIFVREFLLRWHNYAVQLECRIILRDDNVHRADFDFPNLHADVHYRIICVGGDAKLLTRLLKYEQYLINEGYEKIIGLRDMYSEEYVDQTNSRSVDASLNEQFKNGILKTINARAVRPNSIKFCFATMELEAWWLGIPSLWNFLGEGDSQNHQVFFDDPELVFHPAPLIGRLEQLRGSTYAKKKDEVNSIVSQIKREHYVELHESQRCPSFCEFVSHIQTP